MAQARHRPRPPLLGFLTSLIFTFVLATFGLKFSTDPLVYCGILGIWVASWTWINTGQDAIKRAVPVLWLSVMLATIGSLWVLLPDSGWFFLFLVSGTAFLSYLFLNRFLASVVELLWALSLPARLRFPQVEPWRMLLYSRAPLTGDWIWQIVVGKLRRDGSAEAARLLGTAVTDHASQQARSLALRALDQFTDQAGINAICAVWAATRHPDLAELLTRKQWRASAPPEILTLSALLLGQLDFLRDSNTAWIQPLAQASMDADPQIAERAGKVLQGLANVKAQEALCRLVVKQENPPALAAALSAGYLPRDEQERALFLFMSEQWERYASHDFDRRLMHLAYTSSAETLQQRIREKLRAVGRIDFLPIIAGEGSGERASEFNASESEVLVQTLAANHNWSALWSRVFDLPFPWSVRAIDALSQSGWRPEDDEEQALFAELGTLVADGLLMEPAEVWNLFPMAMMQATARVPGRINAVSFAPAHPGLAIGTGQGKVVLWNYQTARRERVLTDFEHSIGKLAFSREGTLLCAERSNTSGPRSIHVFPDVWNSATSFCLGTHVGSITALVPVSGSRLLSAGNDSNVVLWDVSAGKEIRRRRVNSWARSLQVSPDETQLLLVRRGLDLLSFPDLEEVARAGSSTMFRCAAFAPDSQSMFVGTYTGQVLVYRRSLRRRNLLEAEAEPLTVYTTEYAPYQRVEAVEVLKQLSLLVSVGTGGEMRFFNLEGHQPLGNISVPGGQITSLHVSPDESFLVAGSAEATLTLWDLRILRLRLMLEKPFARAEVTILPTLHAMLAHTELTARARQVLQFAQVVLRHRFRYTIEIDEAPAIALGEFDIEID